MQAECKFLEFCLLQRSAKVRSSALLAISGFLLLSQNEKKIFVNFFFLKWRNEFGCVLSHQKICQSLKAKVLIYSTRVLSFLIQIVIFLFQFQYVLLFLALISFHFLQSLALISHVLIFSLSISLCFSFSRSSISSSCLNNLSSRSNASSLILSSRSSFSRLNLSSRSAFSTLILSFRSSFSRLNLSSCSNLNFYISTCLLISNSLSCKSVWVTRI